MNRHRSERPMAEDAPLSPATPTWGTIGLTIKFIEEKCPAVAEWAKHDSWRLCRMGKLNRELSTLLIDR